MPVKRAEVTFRRRVKSKMRSKKREDLLIRGMSRIRRHRTEFENLRERISKRKRRFRSIKGRTSTVQAQRRRDLSNNLLKRKRRRRMR